MQPSTRFASALLLLSFLPICLAQEPEPPSALSEEALQRRITAVEADSLLAESARGQLLALYQQALSERLAASELEQKAADFEREASAAPGVMAAIQEELAQPPEAPRPEVPPDASQGQVELLVSQAASDVASAREQVEKLRSERARRNERRASLDQQMTEAKLRLSDLQDSLRAPSDTSALGEARRVLALAQRDSVEAAIRAYGAELANYEARIEVLPARIDRALRRLSLAEQAHDAWQQVAAERRQRAAEEATREAERMRLEAARQIPALRDLAAQNEGLAHLRSGIDGDAGTSARLDQVQASLRARQEQASQLRERYESMLRKIEAAGLTNSMGLLLRKEKDRLPDLRALRGAIQAQQEQISDVQFQLIVRSEERSTAGDIEVQLAELLGASLAGLGEQEQADLQRVGREILVARRALLDALIADYELLFSRLVELDVACREVVALTEGCLDFIEERILWVRSVSGSAIPDPADAGEALAWLCDPVVWARELGSSLRAAGDRWPEVLLGLLVIVALLSSRFLSRGRIRRMATIVERRAEDSFTYTVWAFLLVLLRATAFPALIVGVSWILHAPGGRASVGQSAAAGLDAAAFALLAYELLRQVLRPDGLGEVHFRWSRSACAHVRWHLRWFMPLVLATVFVVRTLDHQQRSDLWNDALGRIAFVVAQLALAVFLHRILRPSGPVLGGYLRAHGDGWVNRLRHVWFPLAVLLPLSLAALALRGYYYTALRLDTRLQAWIWLFLLLTLAHSLFRRWMRVAGRKLRAQSDPRPGAGEGEPASAQEGTPDSAARIKELIGLAPEEDLLETPDIDAQASRLFRSAVALALLLVTYAVWSDVLPALRRLEQLQIWPRLAVIEAAGPAPVGLAAPMDTEPTPLPGLELVPEGEASSVLPTVDRVTVADLLLALLILAFTLIAAQNLPGLLEILLLRRLALDQGGRYAITTLVRYLIILVGVPMVFDRLGIRWSSVQWLVAALTFGLGFGLQEIFANFVSGLIILFERPIRVGDIVTVEGTSGVVTRIRMRATTITDFDNKELIVPNRQFVTAAVLNWTHPSDIMRVVIPVGIAYGTDVERVRKLLVGLADKHALVLKQPPPSCVAVELAASVLQLELYAFVARAKDGPRVRHDLIRTVEQTCREAGIELPYPQLDVRMRGDAEPPETT